MKTAAPATAVAIALFAVGAAHAEPPPALPGDIGRPFSGLPIPPGAPLPPLPSNPAARSPSAKLALEAAMAAVAACRGFHVGISVVDTLGTPKLIYIPDGTEGFHAYTAVRKAYTALAFELPTSQVGELAKSDAAVIARIKADPNLLSFAGGIPIRAGGKIIGAIGVSGAEPSSKDEACGLAGLERVADRLK